MSRLHVGLAVDDRPDLLDQVEEILQSIGHRCHRAETQEQAEALLEQHRFCYVLLDLELPVRENRVARVQTGYNILEGIRERYPKDELPVIVMTAHGTDHRYATRAFKLGATDFIMKPFDSDDQPLEDKIREGLQTTCEALHETCPNFGPTTATRKKRGGKKTSKKATAKKSPTKKAGVSTRRKRPNRTYPTIHLVGFIKKRRLLVEVNGEQVWIRGQSFQCLCKLIAPRLNGGGPGWIDGQTLGHPAHNIVYRLKEDLEEFPDVVEYILNDGHGMYRLKIPPENLSFAEGPMREDHSHLYGLFEE